MDVVSIMTRDPLTASVGDSLDEVMRTMDQNDIRHVPVLDGTAVVGVLSDRDLLEATGWLPEAQRPEGAPRLVSDLDLGRPVTCSPDDTTVMIASDMTSRAIGCLPVLEGEKLVGIVTEMDLMQAYLDISQMEGSSANLQKPATELMTQAPHDIAPGTTLAEAARLEIDLYVRHLPVTEDHRLVGIVSDRDIRRARGQGKGEDTPISEVMTTEVLTIAPDEPLWRAASYLIQGRISALPVVDDGKLLGILAMIDLLEHCVVYLREPEA
jgi:CBS domain-containing protein